MEGRPSHKLVEQQRAHFDRISDRYEQGRRESNHILLKTLIWRDALKSVTHLFESGVSVLEPMCGAGEGVDILRDHLNNNFSYEGFDYSEKMVAHASRMHPGANIWHADATTFAPRESAYDIIILIGGLHHIPDSASECVRRLANGLRSGGVMINFEPTSGNPLFSALRDYIYRKNDIFDEETERAFSVRELLSMFENAGLKRWNILYPGLAAYTLYYNPYAFPLLNIGGDKCVKAVYGADRLFMRSFLGRLFSFATLSVWRKPE